MTTMTKTTEQDAARDALLQDIKPGDTVYTISRHVSSSGMTHWITPMAIRADHDGQAVAYDLTYRVLQLFGEHRGATKHEGVKRGGCGMDMGFDLVYSISRRLFPQGFECIGERCPSNDHSNGDRDYTPGHVVHSDGGYALLQRWM